MAQKSLCGHSKGGSAAWQMAGLLQSVGTGIIPGNRNNEFVPHCLYLCHILNLSFSNVDANFRKYSYLMFPSKPVHTDGIRAGIMVSLAMIWYWNFTHLTS